MILVWIVVIWCARRRSAVSVDSSNWATTVSMVDAATERQRWLRAASR
nr:hypothetical protein [Actinoplanes rishiriensis]